MNQVSKPACPPLWGLFCERFLGANEKLARQLWACLYPSESADLLYAIARVEDRGFHPEVMRRFGDVATPVLMLKLCLRLAPETGQPRRRDVVEMEETILKNTTSKDGVWL